MDRLFVAFYCILGVTFVLPRWIIVLFPACIWWLIIYAKGYSRMWTLYPAYLALFLQVQAVVTYTPNPTVVNVATIPDTTSVELNTVFFYISMASVCISFICTLVFPIPQFPKPLGSLNVGTFTAHFYEYERLRPTYGVPIPRTSQRFNNGTYEDGRYIFLRIWYPTDKITSSIVYPYTAYFPIAGKVINPLDERMIEKISLGLRGHLLPYTQISRYGRTHARQSPPLSTSQSKYPLVIYSPGHYSQPGSNTALCESIASSGYIVVGIFHNDKDVRYPGPLKRREREVRYVMNFFSELNRNKDQRIDVIPWNSKIAGRVYSDADSFQDVQGLQTKRNLFYNRINFDNGVGIVGHSFGGTTSLMCSSTDHSEKQQSVIHSIPCDTQISCGISLDPWEERLPTDGDGDYTNRYHPVLTKPHLCIMSDLWNDGKNDKVTQLLRNSVGEEEHFMLRYRGTGHANFVDAAWWYYNQVLGRKLVPQRFMMENKENNVPFLGPADAPTIWNDMTTKSIAFLHHFLPVNDDTDDTDSGKGKAKVQAESEFEIQRSPLYSLRQF